MELVVNYFYTYVYFILCTIQKLNIHDLSVIPLKNFLMTL